MGKLAKKQKLDKVASKPTLAKRIKGSPRLAVKKASFRTHRNDAESGSEQEVQKTKDKGKAKEITSQKKKASSRESLLPTNFRIVAGTYEKLLYGLDASVSISSSDGNLEFTLKPIFAFPAHVSCIKAVATSPHGGKWLATGSADEIVKVWDLRRRKEVGGLMHHQGKSLKTFPRYALSNDRPAGSITHLHFPSRSHLLSASEDGTLCLFHTRDWSVLRAMKGHKARVNAVAVHPSGKVALSVGKDKMLRMWDLMRGKGVASTKLGKGLSSPVLTLSSLTCRCVCRGRNRPVVNGRLHVRRSIGINYGHLRYRKHPSYNPFMSSHIRPNHRQ